METDGKFTEKLNSMGNRYALMMTEFKRDAKQLLAGAIGEFLTAHPRVQAVRWTGWAPSFNDGDPCIFHLRQVSIRVEGKDFWDPDYGDSSEISDEDRKAQGHLYDILDSIPEEILEQTFGSSQQVTVTREAALAAATPADLEFDVDYCDEHD